MLQSSPHYRLCSQVLDMEWFLDWYDSFPEQRTIAYSRVDSLKVALENSNQPVKDPIDFLYTLYYSEKKSLRWILDNPIVKESTFTYSVKWLRNLFVESFGWELRLKTDRTPEHTNVVNAQIQEWIDRYESQLTSLICERIVKRDFDILEFNNKKYRIQKALYILNTLGAVNKETLFQISFQWWIWARILANALNKQLRMILEDNELLAIPFSDVELSPQSIARWFQYQYRKREKQ